jgi:predicted RNase H-like nuclease (RuvC/YqgF family)
MKKIILALPALLFILFAACNNDVQTNSQESKVDSLANEVEDVHNIVMPKSMKIPNLRKEISRITDSINKLAPKQRQAAASYLSKLDSLDKELGYAYDSMENWMKSFGEKLDEFNRDSTKVTAEQKIQYYTQEKINIDKIKEAVLDNVQKADSLLRSKF